MSSKNLLEHVPTDYTDLYKTYRRYIGMLAYKAYIHTDDIEDVVMAIFTKLVENDFLSKFDPERGVKFGTVLSSFVLLSLRGHHKRQNVLDARRNVTLSYDRKISGHEDTTWAEMMWDETDDCFAKVESAETLNTIVKHLSVPGKEKLLELFELVQMQVEDYGKLSKQELASIIGISRQGLASRLTLLCSEITEALGSYR